MTQTDVHVSILAATDYDAVSENRLVELLAPLGGMERFVEKGQSVLLKPNLLSNHPPEDAVTTHPELVRAVVRLVRRCGGTPVIADSPANVVKLEQVWMRTGFSALAREENVPLIPLERDGTVSHSHGGMELSVAKAVLDADMVINLPKVKTHVLTTLTAGVKNLYGCIPGFQKMFLHKAFPDPSAFGEMVLAIHDRIRPALTIADGVVAMEGNGPSGGRPFPLGILAASTDAPSLDLALCRILGVDPKAVPYLRAYLRGNPGATDGISYPLLGPSDVMPAGFALPGYWRMRMMPSWIVRLLRPFVWLRPAFGPECVACGRCLRACPAEALTLQPGERPVLNASRCIECCCCHEACPARAITMHQSPLMDFVRRGKLP